MSNLPSDISNGVNNVRNTFSSWDSCMSKSYCKYPAIVGIVLASIIVISIVWCVASCLCCGATLCGSCVRCLTCFGCCGACGKQGGGGGGRSRHKDDYTQMPPTPYNGYQHAAPMTYQPPHAAPQVAQFDASTKKIHADSLPPMPTWENSRSVRVEDHSEPANSFGRDVEMGTMNATRPQARARGGYNQVPLGPISPMSPPADYGHFEGQAHPYNSDIGAQRLGRQQTGYPDFNPSPLSPAPTYHTNPPHMSVGTTDRFTHGAMSPTPSEYHHNNNISQIRDQSWSPLPDRQHEPTDYQSYRRSLSPPVDHHGSNYSYHQQDQSGVRPPSLLQVGRKPVAGSQREI